MRRSLPNRTWQAFLKFLARLTAVAAFGFRCRGRELVPKTGGGLVLSNHQSNLDPVIDRFGIKCAVVAADSILVARLPAAQWTLRYSDAAWRVFSRVPTR